MDLARAMGSTAVVLGVVVAAGFAVGESNIPAPTVQPAARATIDAPPPAIEEPLKRKGPAGGTGPGVPEGSGGA